MAFTHTEHDLVIAMEKVAMRIVGDSGGQAYAPIFERLERELIALRTQDTATQRAKRFLAARRAGET